MHFSLLLGLGGALLACARPLGSDSIAQLPRRSLQQCANDPVWLQFQDSPLQAQASAFCSAYIGQTVTKVVTVYPTTTRTEPVATVTDATIDVTVTDTPTVVDTVTLWYSSSAVVPVTITSVIEDVVPVTDFITTTDATTISTSTDVVTTSVTDTTVTSTVVNTDDITTTDATIYATQTSTLSMTITDATATSTVASYQTVTTTASLVQPLARAVEVEEDEDEEDLDACPAPEPECTSPECLYSSWLDEVSTIATSALSSACSCLVVPATTTSTLLTTGSLATRTIAPSVFATASSRVTAFNTRTSSHVVIATTVIEETSRTSFSVTRTVTSPTTRYVHATASSSAVVTRVATEDEAASTTVTSVESITIDETASATTTIVATATIHETASTTVSVTETTTATVTPSACAQLPSPYYDATTGRTYDLECGYEYSYSTSKIVTLELSVTFLECITACSTYSTCEYVQYGRDEGECFLLSAVTGGQSISVVDVAHVATPTVV